MTTPTTATFAQNTARQAAQRRTADRILSADVAGNERQAKLFALDRKLMDLCTSLLDYRAAKGEICAWVDDKPAPVALIIERMEAEIERRTTPTASYEYQTEDGVYGSDYQPELIY
jgi:hypothetical protein